MTTDERPGEPATDAQAAEVRLESWKEIAAYLRRDVRTVQRWEQTDGLPIHRHKRTSRPIPYAYKAELDAWWTSRSDSSAPSGSEEVRTPPPRRHPLVAAAALSIVVLGGAGAYWAARSEPPTGSATAASIAPVSATAGPDAPSVRSSKSVAVLPLVDLTEGMKNEEFADGMTEEIINRLNRVAGYRVPAPASTFYFKNKSVPVAEIARTLGVAYVVDGSVRRSGATVRVSVRLIHADNADVIWSETYDRPWKDALLVQDDIARKVTEALTTSIEAGADRARP